MKDRLLGGAAEAVDRAASFAMDAGSRASGGARIALSHEARVAFLERLTDEYPREPSLEFFGEPLEICPLVRPVRRDGPREVFDLTWSSRYVPHVSTFAERYLATLENHAAVARCFTRGAPRPIVIIIHGYMSGSFAVEERIWPIASFDAIGFDVALFVLPFHGQRAKLDRRLRPEFPGNDPRMTNEGFRQAMHDLRALVRCLKRRGHRKVGLLGMSLGGYAASLAATIEGGIDFLIPMVPLASIADFAREQGSLSARPDEAAKEHALLERVYRPVSPLSLAPQVAPERVLVVGARVDRVTPISHARRLATHFRAPLIAWAGGHVLQIGRQSVFERIFVLLTQIAEQP